MNALQNEKNIDKSDFKKYIFSTDTIRGCAEKIFSLASTGGTHFSVDEGQLDATAQYVISVIRENYPNLDVPYHSRWRHFEVGNCAQLKKFKQYVLNLDQVECSRLGLDLIIPSVLVDAGAGAQWVYSSSNSVTVGRSEGLALASLDMFLANGFSDSSEVKTTAGGLAGITTNVFKEHFKIDEKNMMRGVEGRVALLSSLGIAIENNPKVFPNQRLGDLIDYLIGQYGKTVDAVDVLALIIDNFGGIWPGRLECFGINLGDTWVYPPLGSGINSYVPIHKLSQWLTYSVIETLEMGGFEITGIEKLTGLAEYRNGGLFVDAGVLKLRDSSLLNQQWDPGSELVVEWRALTIHLLDKLAVLIRSELGFSDKDFPLAKILEGGTWLAGRKLAVRRSSDLSPPINIVSDGTVF